MTIIVCFWRNVQVLMLWMEVNEHLSKNLFHDRATPVKPILKLEGFDYVRIFAEISNIGTGMSPR